MIRMILTYLIFALSTLELFHLGSHLNVVFYFFSKPLKKENFEKIRWYFFIDGITPIINILLLIQFIKIHEYVIYYIIGHLILHLMYSISWNDQPEFVKEIIEWSCSSLKQRESDKDHYLKLFGTLYDIFSHTIMFILDFYVIFKNVELELAALSLVLSFFIGFVLLLSYFSQITKKTK